MDSESVGLGSFLKEKVLNTREIRSDKIPKMEIDQKNLTQQMEQYGLTYVKDIDTMKQRKSRIREGLDFWMEQYIRAETDYSYAENKKEKKDAVVEMKIAIEALYNLCQLEIIPYFKAIHNTNLLIIARMFVFKKSINRNCPNAFPKIIDYVRTIITFFAKEDVTPQLTLVIKNTAPQQHGINPRVPSSPNPLGGNNGDNEQQQ